MFELEVGARAFMFIHIRVYVIVVYDDSHIQDRSTAAKPVNVTQQNVKKRTTVLPSRKTARPDGRRNITEVIAEASLFVKRLEAKLARYKTQLPQGHPRTLEVMNMLATMYVKLHREEEALPLQKESLTLNMKLLPKDHGSISNAMYSLARTYFRLEMHDEARSLWKQNLAFANKVLPENHNLIGSIMQSLAAISVALDDNVDALDMMEQALTRYKRILPPDDIKIKNMTRWIEKQQLDML